MTIEEQIAEIENRLATGAKSVTIDGVTTTFDDADQARRYLAELRRRRDAEQGRNRAVSYIDLSAG